MLVFFTARRCYHLPPTTCPAITGSTFRTPTSTEHARSDYNPPNQGKRRPEIDERSCVRREASGSTRSLKLALLLGGLTLVAVLLLTAAAAKGTNTAQPNSQTQPLVDGCQRNATGLLTFTSPEWVYIYKDAPPRSVQGTVTHTHTAGGDLPEGHDWYDLNSNVNVDPSFSYLISTANFTGDPTAEDYGRLHVEWESGTVPTYLWPTDGDSVQLWRSWIWDCGHWGPSPGLQNPDLLLPGQGEAQCTQT